jgi:hypothetical protein
MKMCLYVDKITTIQELEKEFDTRTFYKLFILKKDGPKPTHIESPYLDFKIRWPGRVELPWSAYRLTSEEALDRVIVTDRAFHVRATEEALKIDRFWVEFFDKAKKENVVSLPVTVRKEDIICFGLQDQVAVKAYEISKESWLSMGFIYVEMTVEYRNEKNEHLWKERGF